MFAAELFDVGVRLRQEIQTGSYSPMVRTTLLSGRELLGESLSCCRTISSYFGTGLMIDLITLFGLVQPEVARVDVGREDSDIALGQIGHELRRMLQVRKAEEGRNFTAGCGHMHRAVAQFDFLLGLFNVLCVGLRAKSLCDQVCVPTVMPASITRLVISGCQVACSPISKNVAFRHSSANALSTAGVLPGQGPSSNVKTTSLSRKKSYCLKCSKPKPPVVSISTIVAKIDPNRSM
jgi:hypothetical protein